MPKNYACAIYKGPSSWTNNQNRRRQKEKIYTYGLALGPWPKVLVIELNMLSENDDGAYMLARTFTATVSTLVPEGRTAALRFITGEPAKPLSSAGESLPKSVSPDTSELIPGTPLAYPPPGGNIWLTGRVGKWRRWRGGVGGLDRPW